jgi:hypothetical protein
VGKEGNQAYASPPDLQFSSESLVSRVERNLPGDADDCAKSPDRELTSEKPVSIDHPNDGSDAAVCRTDPGLDVSKGQEKGKVP